MIGPAGAVDRSGAAKFGGDYHQGLGPCWAKGIAQAGDHRVKPGQLGAQLRALPGVRIPASDLNHHHPRALCAAHQAGNQDPSCGAAHGSAAVKPGGHCAGQQRHFPQAVQLRILRIHRRDAL